MTREKASWFMSAPPDPEHGSGCSLPADCYTAFEFPITLPENVVAGLCEAFKAKGFTSRYSLLVQKMERESSSIHTEALIWLLVVEHESLDTSEPQQFAWRKIPEILDAYFGEKLS